MSVGAWRVRRRMRGRERETGCAKTVWSDSEVLDLEANEVESIWHTYLSRMSVQDLQWNIHLNLRSPISFDNADYSTSGLPF